MEIAFERLLMALETVRGTAVNPPTRRMNLAGLITPDAQRYRPDESTGTLAEFTRSAVVRRSSMWEGEGPLDVFTLPMLLSAALKGGVSPTTPVGATNTRLWDFTPTMTGDDLDTLTLYSGDANVQSFQAAFGTIDDFAIKADSSGTDGVTLSLKGQGRFPAKVAPNSVPDEFQGPLLTPGRMQVWLDTNSAIGTTSLLGRAVSAEFSFSNNHAYKWLAQGPTADLGFSKIGRGKRHAEMKVVLEVPDVAQYDLFGTDTEVKLRVRLNGPLIEANFYHFVEMDIYGPAGGFGWGENQSTNRTIELTIMSEYNAAAGHDFAIRVQSNQDEL